MQPRSCSLCLVVVHSRPRRPDKYNTSQLVSFLQQLLTHGGYYDDNLEFIHVERIQVSQVELNSLSLCSFRLIFSHAPNLGVREHGPAGARRAWCVWRAARRSLGP